MSEAMYERAPYRGVLTHGFAVDEKGRKMSKSLGNVIAPQKVIQNLGADVLRLWVAATDYANEMSVSDEILKRMADSYRRMRNTVRFLLGNLAGFDPKEHSVAPSDMVALDAYALARTRELQDELIEAYKSYAFHLIYQKVHNFCVVDLGGFYLDILKDRLYTTPAQGHARRSAQTAMFHIAESMVRWLAPILSFTAEEIWRHLPGARSESVFITTWHTLPAVPGSSIDWPALIALRANVMHKLEELRDQGAIGSSLDAAVDVHVAPAVYDKVNALADELRFLFITSQARLHKAHVSSVKFYVGILSILIMFTLLTVAVASIHLGPLNLAVAIAIASAKATLVVMFFMHLKYDNRFNATIVICSLMFIGVFFAYTMNDTETRAELDDAQGSMVLPETGQQAPGGLPGTASWHRSHERNGSFYAPNAGEAEDVAPEPSAEPAMATPPPAKGEPHK
jgi:caa(3)-type oxidase subunit IV